MPEAASVTEDEDFRIIRHMVDDLAEQQLRLSKRSRKRYAIERSLSVLVPGDDGNLMLFTDAWAHDVSYAGVSPLTPFELISYKIDHVEFEPIAQRPCHVRVRLCYSKQLVAGVFRSGGHFVFGDARDDLTVCEPIDGVTDAA